MSYRDIHEKELEFTPLEFETEHPQDIQNRQDLLEFTPLEFETFAQLDWINNF